MDENRKQQNRYIALPHRPNQIEKKKQKLAEQFQQNHIENVIAHIRLNFSKESNC